MSINMDQQPWLDDLPDDWLSLPRSSTSSLRRSKQSKLSSFRSNSCNTRAPQAKTAKDHTREPSGSLPLSDIEHDDHVLAEQLSSKRNIPTSNGLGNCQLPNGKKSLCRSSKTTRNASRSISTNSDQSVKRYSVHVRPGKQHTLDCTPEWRKRILGGGIPVAESCDLFGPLQLENVFKPPKNSEAMPPATLPTVGQTDHLWPLPSSLSGNGMVSSEKDPGGAELIHLGGTLPNIPNSNSPEFKRFAGKEIRVQNSPNQKSSQGNFEESQV